jgi:hypothetical protein
MTEYFRNKKIFDTDKIVKFLGRPCKVYKVIDPVTRTKELVNYGLLSKVDETYIQYTYVDAVLSNCKGWLYATETLFDEVSEEQWESMDKTLFIIEIME